MGNGSPGRILLLGVALVSTSIGSVLAAPGAEGVCGACLAGLMLATAAIDADRYIIPNQLTGGALALALVRAGTIGPEAGWAAVMWALLGAAAAALPLLALMLAYRRFRGRDGLGLGDVKLAAVAGAWLSLFTVFAVIELATLSALGAYLASAYLRKRALKATAFVPFGLFLAPAIWIGWLAEALLS